MSQKRIETTRVVWESLNTNGESDFLIGNTCRQATLFDKNRSFKLQGAILLDFGREIYGGIEIICGNNFEKREVPLKIRFGESAGEAMQESVYRHSIQHTVLKVPADGSIQFGLTGFRFVYLEVVEENAYIDLKSVYAILHYRELPYLGTFKCSDPLLNKIWETGAYTVHLNMQEYIWDGIKRDRLVWAGDLHPSVTVINSVFGKVDIVPETLDYLRDTTPLPDFMNGFSCYSIWWLLSLYEYYLYQGDIVYLRRQEEYICGLVRLLAERMAENGAENLPEIRFVDWNTVGDENAIHAGLQALMIMAFKACGYLLKHLDNDDEAEFAESMAEQGMKYLPDSSNKQAVALQVLAGQRDPFEAETRILSIDPLDRLSSFYGLYVLNARADAGSLKESLEMIRSFWGGMLKLGATSFWESFSMSWLENAACIDELNPDKIDVHQNYGEHCYKGYRHSLCHAWSAGPTSWLSKYLLGVTPVKPGFAEVRINRPNLEQLGLEFVQGTFPTPRGIIYVDHGRRKSKISVECEGTISQTYSTDHDMEIAL